jgi:5-methylcytosine-specific restriction endonuclease McrA
MGVLKGKPRTAPWPPYPAWSTSKWWTFLRSKLRSSFTRWPPKYEALADAKRKYTGPNTRQKHEFQCAVCGGWFPQKQVDVDHIVPCGPLRSFEDIGGFIERLFCSKEGLQVICRPCHKIKTAEDRKKKDE